VEVSDSRVEQGPEVGALCGGFRVIQADVVCFFGFGFLGMSRLPVAEVVRIALNGMRAGGVGDGVRLHGRRKALKGEPQERM